MAANPKHARTRRPEPAQAPGTDPPAGDDDRAKASRSLRPREAFRAHLRAIGPDRPKLYLAAVLATVVGALEAAMLLLLARVTMAVATGEDEVSLQVGTLGGATYTVGQAVGILVGVLVAIMIAVGPLSWVQAQLSFRVARRLRSDLVDSYLHSDWAYRKSLREGYLVQLMGDSAQRAEIAIGSVVAGMSGLIVVLVPIVLLAVAQPIMFAMSAVGLVLIASILRPVSSRHKRAAVENARVLGTMASSVSEAARLDSEIAAFHVEGRVASHLDTEIDASSRALRSLRFVGRLVPALFQYLALTAVVALMAGMLASDSATIEEIAPLVLILVRSLTYIRHVITALQSAIELTPFVTSIHDATEDLRAHRRHDGGRTPEGFDRISLHGVGFSFSPDHPVLADVDLELRVGEIVGVVGASGAGKSTLSQLVLGLREPTAGEVRVDEVDLREVDRAWWAERVGYVPQDNQLIYGTVLDNIAFFRPDVDRATCIAAARLAHLDREIEELPDGWDTLLGRGARDLSGGQRQRLGIARALAGRPRMLVLDEPTSALDMRSEQLIRTTLDEIRALTAVLIIAHRPATLEICDRVVRVADGAVAEISAEAAQVSVDVSDAKDPAPG